MEAGEGEPEGSRETTGLKLSLCRWRPGRGLQSWGAGTGLPRCFQEEPALRRTGVGPVRRGQTCDLPWVFCYMNEPESKAYMLCTLFYKTF